jgi:hypothetical protein
VEPAAGYENSERLKSADAVRMSGHAEHHLQNARRKAR